MTDRAQAAETFARSAGQLALDYFRDVGALKVEEKGHQDFVSEADQAVEAHVRAAIAAAFPGDGIVGEEDAPKPSQTGYTWVIDPIDGTTNFVNAIPAWTVVIAVVHDDETQVGVTFDAVHGEMFLAEKGKGAWLNGTDLRTPKGASLHKGTIGTGFSNRVNTDGISRIVQGILADGGVFHRNASGALSLAYVASGRLIGYIEEHMNAWDCLAGQLLIAEAGGHVEPQSARQMIADGGRVVVGADGVFEDLVRIADRALGPLPT